MSKSSITTQGEIVLIESAVTRGNFRSREFRLRTDGEYPQTLKFEMHKERGDVLDNFRKGDRVEISWEPRGNVPDKGPHEGKCFVALVAWKAVKLDADGNPMTGKFSERPDRGDPMEEHERNRARQTATKSAPPTGGDGDEDGIPW